MTAVYDNTTLEPTDAGFDLADEIELWLEAHPGWHTPSTIARGVRNTGTTDVWTILCWMDGRQHVLGSGNGRLRRYQAWKFRR